MPWPLVVAAISAVISAAAAAGSAVQQAKGARSSARAESRASRTRALQAQQAASAEEGRIRRRNKREMSRRRAQLGGSGVEFSGSPFFAHMEAAAELELDAANARIEGYNTSLLENERSRRAIKSGNRQAGAALLSGAAGVAGAMGSFAGAAGGGASGAAKAPTGK